MAKNSKLSSTDIATIKDVFEKLRVITGKQQVPFWELAKELGVNKVPLFDIMTSMPDQFIIGTLVKKKGRRTRNDSMTENLTGEAYSTNIVEENKGLHVFEIYITPEENPLSPQHLQYMATKYAKYIHITRWVEPTNSRHTALIIKPDEPPHDDEESQEGYYIWRNTPSKITFLKNALFLKPAMFSATRGNEVYDIIGAYVVTAGDIENIKKLGWQTNNDY